MPGEAGRRAAAPKRKQPAIEYDWRRRLSHAANLECRQVRRNRRRDQVVQLEILASWQSCTLLDLRGQRAARWLKSNGIEMTNPVNPES